jgi:VWFA-related protein
MRKNQWIMAVCSVLLAAAPAVAQQDQAGDSGAVVFHSAATQVMVDAVVTNKDGHSVKNLSAKDFHLIEDGKEQAVQSATQQSAQPQGAPQYVVLLMDMMRFDDQVTARQNAKVFAEHIVGPRRFMALLSYHGHGHINVDHAPSNDLTELFSAIDGMKTAAGISNGGPVGGGRSARSGATMTGGSTQKDYSSGVTYIGNSMQNVAIASSRPGSFDRQSASGGSEDYDVRSLLEALRQVTQSLSTLPGRKAIIFLTPGFRTSSNEQRYLDTLVGTANRGNVSFYPIQVRYSSDLRQVLRAMAEETGGISVGGNNDLAGAFRAIEHDQQEYYELSYNPAHAAPNTCHNLGVKVDVPDVVVRARKEYCNYRPTDPLQGSSTDTELLAHASSETEGGIPTHLLAPYFYNESGTGRLSIAAQFPLTAFKAAKNDKKFRLSFHVLGVAYKPDGSTGARFSETVTRDFDSKEQLEQFQQTPYNYRTEFEVPTGMYNLSLVVSPENGVYGKTDIPVRIDAWDGHSLMLSGLALSKSFKPASPNGGDVESVLSANHIPLVSKGLQFDPASSTTFKKTEPAAVYFEIYEPRLLQTDAPGLTVNLRIANRKTGETVMDFGQIPAQKWQRPGSATVPVALTLPLSAANLPAGDYRIYIKALESDGTVSVVRSQNITVTE